MNNLEYFHMKIDLLIGLIDISDKQLYEMIKDNKHESLGISMEEMFNYKYENYSNLITTSVLILGLSHFEDFLGKCIAVILAKHPER
ncbi:MAG: hypothetical protein M3R36_12480 [Bacteroidota bacterium]|nr:hypothetical protein [Bacteroidota bacterium]